MHSFVIVLLFFLIANAHAAKQPNPFEELMKSLEKEAQAPPKKVDAETSAEKPAKKDTSIEFAGHNKQEQEILKTVKNLPSIADALAKFTQSSELKASTEEQLATQKKKEQDAEQFKKRMLERTYRPYWSPSTQPWQQPYRSSYSSSSPWSAGSGAYGDYGYTPKGYGRGLPSSATSSSFPSTTQPGTQGKDSLPAPSTTTSSKADTGEKEKRGSSSSGTTKKAKRAYESAVEQVKGTQQIAQQALAVVQTAGVDSPIAAAKALLDDPRQLLPKLAQRLEYMDERITIFENLADNEKTFLEKEHKDQLKNERTKLKGQLQQLAQPLLYAATLDQLDGQQTIPLEAQQKALGLCKDERIHITQKMINDRAKELLGKGEWQQYDTKKNAITAALATRVAAAAAVRVAAAPAAGGPPTVVDLTTYFTTCKSDLDRLTAKFPKPSTTLAAKQTEIQRNLDQLARP